MRTVDWGRVCSELPRVDVRFEKMNVSRYIEERISEKISCGGVLVAGCGPKSLGDDIEDWGDAQELRVDIHCEDFDN